MKLKAGQMFDSVIEKYFKNIVINLIFSAVITFLFYIESRIPAAANPDAKVLAVIIVCKIIGVLFCAVHTACIMHRFPCKDARLLLTVFIWSMIFFAMDFLMRICCSKWMINEKITAAIFAAIYILLSGVMTFSLSVCICKHKVSLFHLFFGNIWPFFKMTGYCVVVFVILFVLTVIPVNTTGGKRGVRVVPKEITEKWEPIILSAVIFLFVPMYNIAIIQLFQSISDANNSSE